MWGAGEEIVTLDVRDSVLFEERCDVTSLGDRVAAEVDDTRWFCIEELVYEVGVEAGARWINDDDFVRGDVVEGLFGGG